MQCRVDASGKQNMTESVRRVCMELLGLLKSKDFSFKTLGIFELFWENDAREYRVSTEWFFLNWSLLVQYQNEKRRTSQAEALLGRGFHKRAALVGSLAFSILLLNWGGGRGFGAKSPSTFQLIICNKPQYFAKLQYSQERIF